MAILIKKTKPVAPVVQPLKPHQTLAPAELGQLIDKVGREGPAVTKLLEKLKKIQDELKPYKKDIDLLQGEIDKIEGFSADEVLEVISVDFLVEAGVKATVRTVADKEKILEYLGSENFLKLCDIKLKVVDDYLTPEQKEEVLTIDRTKRTIKILPTPKS